MGAFGAIGASSGDSVKSDGSYSVRFEKESEAWMGIRISSIKENLEEIIELMNIDFLMVCIDEWMTLDDSATTDLQTEFAELLKRLFGKTPKIGLKIASVRRYTRLQNIIEGHIRGLKIEADIFPTTNLEWAVLSEDELLLFYEKILTKRLIRSNPAIEELFKDQHDEIHPYGSLIDFIFKDKLAFKELVRGAQGVPRYFIEFFNGCIHKVRGQVRKNPLTYSLVRDTIHELSFTGRLSDVTYDTKGEIFLVKCIKRAVQNSYTELFLIPRTIKCNPLNEAVDELLQRKIILEFPDARLPSNVRENYGSYVLAYGAFLDWQRAFLYGNESIDNNKLMHYTIPSIKEGESFSKHIIEMEWIYDAFPNK